MGSETSRSTVSRIWQPTLLALVALLVLIFVQVASLAVGLSGDQNWGGDWAQYVIHAENLSSFRRYMLGLDGLGLAPAPLPYVVVLTVVGALPANILLAAQVLNVGLLMLILVPIFRYLNEKSGRLVALIAILAILRNPFVMGQVTVVGPGLFFAALSVQYLTSPQSSRRKTALLVALCATRIEAVVFLVLLIFERGRDRRLRIRDAFLGSATLGFTLAILPRLLGAATYGVSSSNTAVVVRRFLNPSLFRENVEIIQDSVVTVLVALGRNSVAIDEISSSSMVAVFVLIFLIAVGMNSSGLELDLPRMVWGMCTLMSVVAVYFILNGYGAFPQRYMLGPGLIFLMIILAAFSGGRSRGNSPSPAFIPIAVLALSLVLGSLPPSSHPWFARTNFVADIASMPFESSVAFVKPRVMEYSLRQIYGMEHDIEVLGLRSEGQAKAIIEGGGCGVVEHTDSYSQREVLGYFEAKVDEAYFFLSNDSRSIYCF